MKKLPLLRIGDQVFAEEGGTEFGAVRQVGRGGRPELMVYVENAGDFVISLSAVNAVHDGKVVLDLEKLDPSLRLAIKHAHEREEAFPAPARKK
jgi:hypothetical protein